MSSLSIRCEEPIDFAAIEKLHDAAFGTPAEASLVACLRASPGFDSRLSLVAVQRRTVVGHILFSDLQIQADGVTTPGLALAPMAVLPDQQRRGIGSALVTAGLEACRVAGHAIVLVVGHPEYYRRFGFVPADGYGISIPFDVPREAFMALELKPGALEGVRGRAVYHPCFDGFA